MTVSSCKTPGMNMSYHWLCPGRMPARQSNICTLGYAGGHELLSVVVEVPLDHPVHVSDSDRQLVEDKIHDAVETVLAKYWNR